MQRFLLRRALISIVILLIVSVIIFAMSRAAGDPRHVFLDDYSTQEDWEHLSAGLGLDKPYYHQYLIFLSDALRGDLGTSIHQDRPVLEVIRERLPATFQLGLTSFFISVIIGLPLGVLSAVRRGSLLDTVAKGTALIGQSAPVFWLGLMLMFFFAVTLDVLPPYGRQQTSSIILPAVTLGWFFVAANLRLVRSAMLDVLDSEYIKLARAKGVPPLAIIWKHGLRNALIPAITYAGVTLGGLVTGSVVVETVFAWPGLGQLAIQALFGNDYPMLQGVVIVFTLMYVLASLLVDVIYTYVDPRIRYS